MGISIKVKGDFSKTDKFLDKVQQRLFYKSILEKYGEKGVEALRSYTPKRTGITANSWYYNVEYNSEGAIINWMNDHQNDGVIIAVIIQYGHGTKNGGYVRGVDYINPAMKNIFQGYADEIWKEVTK